MSGKSSRSRFTVTKLSNPDWLAASREIPVSSGSAPNRAVGFKPIFQTPYAARGSPNTLIVHPYNGFLADIKLFRIDNGSVAELPAESVAVEKSLQSLLEKHLEAFLEVRFLATEYATGKTHGGRIDTLGLDDNNCPVIIEYKRTLNENVINQGLYYLDWLMDHKGEFTLLAMKKLGAAVSDQIEWSSPRLLCIAGDFTKFDEHAVQQINRNIELLRYRRYGDGLLLLELVNASSADTTAQPQSAIPVGETGKAKVQYKGFGDLLPLCSTELKDLWAVLPPRAG